jgi:hypothetical protein
MTELSCSDYLDKHELSTHEEGAQFIVFIEKSIEKKEDADTINRCLDFLKSPVIKELNKPNPTLNVCSFYRLPIEKLLAKEKKYNKKVADNLINKNEFSAELGEGEEHVANLDDKFFIVSLTTKIAMTKESAFMQHCVGHSSYYFDQVKGKSIKIYSLRDVKNKPHATMSYNIHDNTMTQIQGKQNKQPHEKYHLHLYTFITKEQINLSKSHWLLDKLRPFKGEFIMYHSNAQYEKDMKEVYDNNNWQLFVNHFIDVKDMTWFLTTPNIHVQGLNASGSGLTTHSDGFFAEVIDQSKCANAINSPNFGCKKFLANDSGLSHYGEKFSADFVDQSNCINAKIAPNHAVHTFLAKKSGLTQYPDNFSADIVDQTYCEKATVAPNCQLKDFMAQHSGLISYPENFSADTVNQTYCGKAKIAPNCEMAVFIANDSGLTIYPKLFKALNVQQRSCKLAKSAPHCQVDHFDASCSNLSHYPETFKAKTVNQSYCLVARIAPNCALDEFDAKASGLESYPEKFSASLINQVECKSAKIAPNCHVDKFLARNSALTSYPEGFTSDYVSQIGCRFARSTPNCKLKYFYAAKCHITEFAEKFEAQFTDYVPEEMEQQMKPKPVFTPPPKTWKNLPSRTTKGIRAFLRSLVVMKV